MSRYESPGQVALLLAGATLASLLLIVLFTAETKGRRPSRDLALEGVSSLRQQASVRLAPDVGEEERREAGGGEGIGPSGSTGWRAKRGLGSGGGGGRAGLQVSRGEQDDEEGEEEEDEHHATPSTTTTTTTTPRPRHALRHRHRQHSRHRLATSPRPHHSPVDVEEEEEPQRPHHHGGDHGGWAPPPRPSPPEGGGATAPAGPRVTTYASEEGDREVTASSSSPRDGHAACYGPDQVVLIIALTCALNFACIFLVMALVHVCNRNRKCTSSGCDSPLLLVDSDFEAEAKACLAATAASTSADEDEDDWDEVDALLLSSKRTFAVDPPHAFLAPFAPGLGPPWRPSAFPPPRSALYPPLGPERRRPLPSSASSTAVGLASSRPLLPPAAFSMEDLHILE